MLTCLLFEGLCYQNQARTSEWIANVYPTPEREQNEDIRLCGVCGEDAEDLYHMLGFCVPLVEESCEEHKSEKDEEFN